VHPRLRRHYPQALPPPGPHLAPHRTRPPFDSRQAANSLSAANKLSIRCAWVGTSAFVRPSPLLAMVARAELLEAAPVAEMAALKIGWPAYVQRARHGHARCGGASLSLGGAAGAGVDQLTGARAARRRTEAGLGFEATIAPDSTSSLAAEGGKPAGSGT
jgi:hypothetical protein